MSIQKLSSLSFYKRIIISAFIVCLGLVNLVGIKAPASSLVLEVKTDRPDVYQVFYDTGNGFNERESQIFLIPNSSKFEQAYFSLPSKVRGLRIDFGSSEADILIKSIQLRCGYFKIYRWEGKEIEKDFSITHNTAYKYQNDMIGVSALADDPWIKYGHSDFSRKISGPFRLFFSVLAIIAFLVLLNLRHILRYSMSRLRNYLRLASILMALIVSPILLFISSSTILYLNNQAIFGHRVEILYPFVFVSLSLLGLGFVFYIFSEHKPFKHLLCAYLAAGPAFMGYSMLIFAKDSFVGVVVLLGLFTLFYAIIYRTMTRKIMTFFALFGVFLLCYEVLVFSTNVQSVLNRSSINDLGGSTGQSKKLPNIYHIVLDEYQTEMFDITVTEDTIENLSGFVYFPKNISNYGRTVLSLSTMSQGAYYDYNTPLQEFISKSFGWEHSIVGELKKAGYKTHAIMFGSNIYPNHAFDYVFHIENDFGFDAITDSKKLFWNLWRSSVLPKAIYGKMMEPVEFQRLKHHNLMPGAWVASSHNVFRNFMDTERYREAYNQYFFMHLTLPHVPYIMTPECTYEVDNDGRFADTSALEQAQCTTYLIGEFIRRLKELGRFDGSLIIVQSDHGARFEVEDGELIDVESLGYYDLRYSWARARALLLVKTLGRGEADAFEISDFRSSLIDIAPTIYDLLDIEVDYVLDGVSLLSAENSGRVRFYYFYDDVRGAQQITDRMARYIYKDDHVIFDEFIHLNN
jgi:hypothetical protein